MGHTADNARIRRTTLFKVPDPENQRKLLEAYRVMEKTHAKACVPLFVPWPTLTAPIVAERQTIHPRVCRGRSLVFLSRGNPADVHVERHRSHVGIAKPDRRARGYTVVANHSFATAEDVDYYDHECRAHDALKETAAGLGIEEPPVVVHVEDGLLN